MDSLIEAYLSKLETRLAKRLPKQAVEANVREIGGHIRECVADLIQQGKGDREATVEALRRVGRDSLVADSLIREYLGLSEMSSWRLAWIPCAILLAYFLIPLTFTEVNWAPDWLSTTILCLPTCFLILFVYTCWKGRRLLIKPFFAVAAIVVVGVLIQCDVYGPLGITEHAHQQRLLTLKGLSRQITGLQSDVVRAESLNEGYSKSAALQSKPPFQAPAKVSLESNSTGPFLPFEFKGLFDSIVLTNAPSAIEAREMWNRNGNAYVNQLRDQLNEARKNQKFWLTAKLDVSQFRQHLFNIGGPVSIGMILLALLNLTVLGASRLYRAASSRLWRPEGLA